jgi:hypothetical protein
MSPHQVAACSPIWWELPAKAVMSLPGWFLDTPTSKVMEPAFWPASLCGSTVERRTKTHKDTDNFLVTK